MNATLYYTDKEIAGLARRGVKRLLVMWPAFVSDCLETLGEIGMRGRETFRESGGEELALIPCLNEHPTWLRALERMVTQRWPGAKSKASQSHECLNRELVVKMIRRRFLKQPGYAVALAATTIHAALAKETCSTPPLTRFWEGWDGATELACSLAALDASLKI